MVCAKKEHYAREKECVCERERERKRERRDVGRICKDLNLLMCNQHRNWTIHNIKQFLTSPAIYIYVLE